MIFLKISQPLVFNCHIHLEINRKMELWIVFMALAFIGVSKSLSEFFKRRFLFRSKY